MDNLWRDRRLGLIAIGLSAPVALALWFVVDLGLAPLMGMQSAGARLVLALKCWCVTTLFSLVLGIDAVAHERLFSPAFDPLAGFETRRQKVNQRYLQNTLEQTVIFAAALFGLALYCPTGSSMRAVVATSVVWLAARLAFWIGYHQSAALRILGAPGLVLSEIVLVYVGARIGAEVAGPAGGWAVVALFLAAEAFLFWATRPLRRAPADDGEAARGPG